MSTMGTLTFIKKKHISWCCQDQSLGRCITHGNFLFAVNIWQLGLAQMHNQDWT